MRIVRYRRGPQESMGVLDSQNAVVHALERDAAGTPRQGPAVCGRGEVTLLCPCAPGKIVSVGANYADRCVENGLPVPNAPGRDDTFVMPGAGVAVGDGALIRLPPWEGHVEYGAELGIVIGRACEGIGPGNALDHALGYVALNNLWAKTRPRVPGAMNIRVYDSFCPMGPWIETALDPNDLEIRLLVDGRLRQSSRTSRMLFDVGSVISHVSHQTRLAVGDVIMTGTPSGVRPVADGDVIEIEIEGIGRLRNRVAADPAATQRPLRRVTE